MATSFLDEKRPLLENKSPKPQRVRDYGFCQLILDCGSNRDKAVLLLGVVMTVATGLVSSASFFVYGSTATAFIIHAVSNKTSRVTEHAKTAFTRNINQVLVHYALLAVAQFVIYFVSSMAVMVPSVRIVNNLRRRFLRHIVRADMKFLETQRTGELNAMFHDHMERVLEALSNYGYIVLYFISGTVFGVLLSLCINWKQTLCAGILVPIIAFVGVLAMRMVTRKVQLEQTLFGKAATLVDETLSNITTVLSFNGQIQTLQKFNNLLRDANSVSARRALIEGVANGIDIFVSTSIGGIAFLFGAFFVASYHDIESRGLLYTVALTLLMAGRFISFIQAPLSSFLGAKANLTTLGTVLQSTPDIDSLETSGESVPLLPNGGATIKFHSVSFAYPSRPDVKVLDNVSFVVSAGEHIGIVGASGAGKSTVANLILRFYEATSGTISINGCPLGGLDLSAWRQTIGYVSQNAPIFDGTVEENIRLGYPNATRAEVMKCIQQADLEKFIDEMPEGYDTWVGDRGVQLSGGQRQRVAIARALIREPAVFVFDEATSSLDSVTEQTVVDEIEKVVQGRTTVTIAHRLATVRNADRILVLDRGRIVEEGSHERLIDLDERYAHMVKMQALQQGSGGSLDDSGTFIPNQVTVSSYGETSDPEMRYSDAPNGPFGLVPFQLARSNVLKRKNEQKQAELDTSTALQEGSQKMSTGPVHGRCSDFLRLFTCADWCKLTLSLVGSLVSSIADTLSVLAIGSMLLVLPLSLHQMQHGVIWLSLCNLGAAFAAGLGRAFFTYWQNRFGDEASGRVRARLFGRLLRHNLSFYDKAQNSSGILSTILVKNPAKIRKAINQDLLLMPSAVWSFLLQMSVALWINAPFTLFCMLTIPIDLILYSLTNYANVRLEKTVQAEQEKAGKIATEILDNLPTVQAYSLEEILCRRYEERLQPIVRGYIKEGALSSAFMSLITCKDMIYSGLIIKVGASFVASGDMTAVQVWIVFSLVSYLSVQLMLALTEAQDVVRAYVAASSTVGVLRQPLEVDCMSEHGVTPALFTGIKMKGVRFSYPSRPDVDVLCDVTANIKVGKTLAIVGPSGSGKSTVMLLLQRLYEPTKGKIEIDGFSVDSLNIRWLRNHIVPVNQEPVLFNGTIRENILYGLDAETVGNEQIFAASRMANAHGFVCALPEGYNTDVGAKGLQLSGGQRQRIAIARALVRNPKVLLLDEATASLDTDNEQAVQTALDGARKERTCVVVAHRLSTVQNAHRILVMMDGKIVERGNHATLLARQGLYYHLCVKQRVIDA